MAAADTASRKVASRAERGENQRDPISHTSHKLAIETAAASARTAQ